MRHRVFWLVLLLGLALVGRGAWIPAKAWVAQLLLERAWGRALEAGGEQHPWPWADSWPVARLSVPRLGVERIVLAGVDGSSLAFGPGHDPRSAEPGSGGNVAVAGHRDTHFAFVRRLEAGDEVEVEDRSGTIERFQVEWIGIVEASASQVLAQNGESLLTLVTCYPFEAVAPGGSLRYVVRARAREAGEGPGDPNGTGASPGRVPRAIGGPTGGVRSAGRSSTAQSGIFWPQRGMAWPP